MSALLPLFTWRSAICESTLRPTTRHVALTLSLYMDKRGSSAHPGAERLARDTGLHVSTVRAELKALVEAGWLVLVAAGGRKGEARRANDYEARLPSTPLPLAFDDGSKACEQPAPLAASEGSCPQPVAEAEGSCPQPVAEAEGSCPQPVAEADPSPRPTRRRGRARPLAQDEANSPGNSPDVSDGSAQPSATDPAPTAQLVVARYVARYRAGHGGADPPSQLVGQLARAARRLLADGKPVQLVACAAEGAAARNRSPSLLAALVADLETQAAPAPALEPSRPLLRRDRPDAACPDCAGSGWTLTDAGATRCAHPLLVVAS